MKMKNLVTTLRMKEATFTIKGDDKIIPFSALDKTIEINEVIEKSYNYLNGVEQAYLLIPNLSDNFYFKELKLVSNVWFNHKNFIDWDSDEYYGGSFWKGSNKAFGIAVAADNYNLDDHIGYGKHLPYYSDIDEKLTRYNDFKFLIAKMALDDFEYEYDLQKLCTFDIAFDIL